MSVLKNTTGCLRLVGDSSVLDHLFDGRCQSVGGDIEKQECVNHEVKCFRSSLEQLAKEKPQYKSIEAN